MEIPSQKIIFVGKPDETSSLILQMEKSVKLWLLLLNFKDAHIVNIENNICMLFLSYSVI